MDKKHSQLGMNPSTASQRLVKDTLFRLALELGHVCYRCQQPLIRETFSVEHIEPWLDSADPKAKFFDQSNIAFSHQVCNVAAARRPRDGATQYPQHVGKRRSPSHYAADDRREYRPEKRKEQYRRHGR